MQEKIVIDGKTEAAIENCIGDAQKLIEDCPDAQFCLIITGDALIHAIKERFCQKIVNISDYCNAVIACRVSPKQKQEIVTLVKTSVEIK